MKRYFLLIFILLFATTALAANSVTLGWEPSPSDVDGYIIYYGQTPDALTFSKNVGPVLTTVIDNLAPGDWYFAATAYNEIDESVRSNVVNTSFAGFAPTETLHIPITKPATVNITITVE